MNSNPVINRDKSFNTVTGSARTNADQVSEKLANATDPHLQEGEDAVTYKIMFLLLIRMLTEKRDQMIALPSCSSSISLRASMRRDGTYSISSSSVLR